MKPSACALVVLAASIGAGCSKEASLPASPPKVRVAASPAPAPVTEAALGLPFYPGATVKGGRAQGKLVNADLETSDAPGKALEFYEKALGVKAIWRAPVTWFEGSKGGYKYAVTVMAQKGQKTEISIMGERVR
ncbi:MAG TPA: hypothetical protein VMI31_07865 [Fimbriimonadaceae bacterium]|nr:hypothetical protein [Fimbriimonadaceae bacterium]